MSNILQFSRSRRTQVEHINDSVLVSNCSLQDNLTDAFIEITIKLPDLEITDIRGQVRRSPRPVGPDDDQRLRQAIGIRIGAGMTEIIRKTLKDHVVFKQYIFMLEECCHAVILSLTKDVLAGAPPDKAGKTAFFSKMVQKNIRMLNRCAAFAPGSPLVNGIEPPRP